MARLRAALPQPLRQGQARPTWIYRLCNLGAFDAFETIIALPDFTAAGDRRVTLEERHADLARRYGPSPFLDGSLAIARALAAEFEEASGSAPADVL